MADIAVVATLVCALIGLVMAARCVFLAANGGDWVMEFYLTGLAALAAFLSANPPA